MSSDWTDAFSSDKKGQIERVMGRQNQKGKLRRRRNSLYIFVVPYIIAVHYPIAVHGPISGP